MSEQLKRARPCDACRRRKTKCVTEDGNSICVLCRFHAQECTHDEAPRPRKRPTSSDGAVVDEPKVKRSRTTVTRPGTGIEEYDTLPGPSLLKRTLGLQNLHHSQYVGPNSVLDVTSCGSQFNQDVRRNSVSAPVKVRFVHPLHAFTIVPDAGTPGHGLENPLLDEIERAVCGNGPELVRLYFRIVHPAFPILHKEVFLEKYARTYKEFSPPLLASVYLLASGYWSFSEALASAAKPDLSKLKQLARSSLQHTIKRPKLSTVQAALLIAQHQATDTVDPGEGSVGDLTLQLVDLAYGLGLHLDPSDWDLPEWEKGLRRRLSCAIHIQDKWTALLTGRPPMISLEAWDVDPLTDADFPEQSEDATTGSSEVEKGRLVFMHMASLTVILHSLLGTIFSPSFQRGLFRAVDKVSPLLAKVKPLQIQLKEWFATLPESIKMDTVAGMKLSSVGYLRLAYLTVEVCVHRQLIKALSETSALDSTVATICRAAAKERFSNGVEFVQHLQALHLASFWYFSSSQCCVLIHHFGRALEATASQAEERTQLAQRLSEYKWTLKVNSEAGAGFMKHALTLIDQSSRVVLASSGDRSVTTSPAEVREGMASLAFTPYIAPVTQQYSYESQNNGHDPDALGAHESHFGQAEAFAGSEAAWDLHQQFGDYGGFDAGGLSAFAEDYAAVQPP
ncbi:hypothetical protein LTR85_007919 [Meristemomyces frigidus]|nr:hypothetical protein LTR85_007919 [Meristemomyces frigidus]